MARHGNDRRKTPKARTPGLNLGFHVPLKITKSWRLPGAFDRLEDILPRLETVRTQEKYRKTMRQYQKHSK